MKQLIEKLNSKILALMLNNEGQSLVEYGLCVALIAFGCTVAMQNLGAGLGAAFSNISSTLAGSLT